jgi:hypothetical protein
VAKIQVFCNFKRLVKLSENKTLRIVPINIAGSCAPRDVVVAWTYGGEETLVDEPMRWSAIGDPYPPIYNICELNHDGPTIFGIDMSLATYPPHFRPRPVDGGGATNDHRVDRIVEVWSLTGCECENSIWVMNEMSAHDGVCGVPIISPGLGE